jgi:hypothetical protein
MWFWCLPGKSSSKHSIFLSSEVYAKGLNVLIHLQLGPKNSHEVPSQIRNVQPTFSHACASPERRVQNTFVAELTRHAAATADVAPLLRQLWALTKHRSDLAEEKHQPLELHFLRSCFSSCIAPVQVDQTGCTMLCTLASVPVSFATAGLMVMLETQKLLLTAGREVAAHVS